MHVWKMLWTWMSTAADFFNKKKRLRGPSKIEAKYAQRCSIASEATMICVAWGGGGADGGEGHERRPFAGVRGARSKWFELIFG